MPLYITHIQTGWRLCYLDNDGRRGDHPITNDDLRFLQHEIGRILGGPPAARSWTRKTQTDIQEHPLPLLMEHKQDEITLARGGDPIAWSHEAVGLDRREATQVRDFLDYWLLHWNGSEEFPRIGPTEGETPDGN